MKNIKLHKQWLQTKRKKCKLRFIRLLKKKKKILEKECELNRIRNIENRVSKGTKYRFVRPKKNNKKPITVTCPANFSIVQNPEESIACISKLQANLKQKNEVFIDMLGITNITHDAIVVLMSIMCEFKRLGVDYNGNFPLDKNSQQKFNKSGFFRNIMKNDKIKYDNNNNTYLRKHGKSTHGEDAKRVVRICSNKIWNEGRRCQGVYRTLVELMQNTHSHASKAGTGRERWWLSVNYDEERKTVYISFFDYGIGIFNSLENKEEGSKFYNAIPRILELLKIDTGSDEKILKAILEGEMHLTCTGLPFRGKGLPGIKQTLDRNQISNLVIIANKAFGRVFDNTYKKLENSLSGTFVYWELTSQNISCHE